MIRDLFPEIDLVIDVNGCTQRQIHTCIKSLLRNVRYKYINWVILDESKRNFQFACGSMYQMGILDHICVSKYTSQNFHLYIPANHILIEHLNPCMFVQIMFQDSSVSKIYLSNGDNTQILAEYTRPGFGIIQELGGCAYFSRTVHSEDGNTINIIPNFIIFSNKLVFDIDDNDYIKPEHIEYENTCCQEHKDADAKNVEYDDCTESGKIEEFCEDIDDISVDSQVLKNVSECVAENIRKNIRENVRENAGLFGNRTQKQKNWKETKITLDDLKTHSVVISIDQERCDLFHKIFDKFLGFVPIVIHGSVNKELTHVQNCLQSHINCIKYAKKHNWPFVLVFEDDAIPSNDCIDRIVDTFNNRPEDTGILMLGWSSANKRQSFADRYNRLVSFIAGAHSYIVFQGCYDIYLNMTRNMDVTADGIFKSIPQSYVISDPLFIQYNSKPSMNGHSGYIFNGDHRNRISNFPNINDFLPNINKKETCKRISHKYHLKKSIDTKDIQMDLNKSINNTLQALGYSKHRVLTCQQDTPNIRDNQFVVDGKYQLAMISLNNFGDKVSNIVVEQMTQKKVDVININKHSNSIVTIGSIMSRVSTGDAIWGTGFISQNDCFQKKIKSLKIFAVRGPLTRDKLNQFGFMCPEVYGDPGIFIPFAFGVHRNTDKIYDIGIIPHKIDYNYIKQRFFYSNSNVKIIDLTGDPIEVVKQISKCKRTISSSLHGIVVSEALGIPCAWVEFSNRVIGNGFKFYDYYLGSGRSIRDVKRNDCIGQFDINSIKYMRPATYDIDGLLASSPFDFSPDQIFNIKEWFNDPT